MRQHAIDHEVNCSDAAKTPKKEHKSEIERVKSPDSEFSSKMVFR